MATIQSDWRFCSKCYCLFFAGQANKSQGSCAAGGQHDANVTVAGKHTQPDGPQGGGPSGNYELTKA